MTDAIRHTFPKAEKLKSRKQIDLLFREGKSFFAAPVKCFYRISNPNGQIPRLVPPKRDSKGGDEIRNGKGNFNEQIQNSKTMAHTVVQGEGCVDGETINNKPKTINIQCGFSVSKKQFKKAVDRNRVKRLMREAYRLHKHKLKAQVEAKNMGLEIFFVFTDKTLPDFKLVEEKIKYCLRRLGKIMEDNG